MKASLVIAAVLVASESTPKYDEELQKRVERHLARRQELVRDPQFLQMWGFATDDVDAANPQRTLSESAELKDCATYKSEEDCARSKAFIAGKCVWSPGILMIFGGDCME
eukprot:CAMPEP_0197071496 /NCGR_PEP_ID=MMETSP1384-20130603/207074_1 /TAXON_ID=29189 /ORGANISM="Ammonia sp." /LENGTH=109 /DNA_ID=CAMNT_0042510167 /DNA_START=527 /DNA_END=853 /DNA_ORIENTATION=+